VHDIICPHCGKAFKVDGAGYANILKQVPRRLAVNEAVGAVQKERDALRSSLEKARSRSSSPRSP
jgi:hypothetical protein